MEFLAHIGDIVVPTAAEADRRQSTYPHTPAPMRRERSHEIGAPPATPTSEPPPHKTPSSAIAHTLLVAECN